MDFDFAFEKGMVQVMGKYADEKYGNAVITLELKLLQLLEMAAEATDNEIDDKLVDMIRAALGEDK